MFFIAMRTVEVPRHFDARLYSRSRMMTTCVLMKYAILIQPVIVIAKTMDQKLAVNNITRTEISKMYGTLPTML